MGCQDLAEEVPGRTRREHPASPDLRSFVKGVTGRSSSKSYSVKDETSSEFSSIFSIFLFIYIFSRSLYLLSVTSIILNVCH